MIHRFDLALPQGITLACRANVASASSGSGGPRPRVMLLHGFPEAAFAWDEILQRLQGRVDAVAPNLRGYPGSSAPAGVPAYHPRELVADLAAAIEAMGAPLDLLVAHDWGGALAWNLAAARPALMKRLLIVNAPHPAAFLRELRHNPEQQAAGAYMNFLRRPDAAPLLAENGFARLWRFFGETPPAWLTPALRQAYEAAWQAGLEGPLNYYRASPLHPPLGPDDALHRLELPDAAVSVRLPTTVLWGEADVALRPALLDGLERWVPQLHVERVPEAGHWIVHEQPARVAGWVERLAQAGA